MTSVYVEYPTTILTNVWHGHLWSGLPGSSRMRLPSGPLITVIVNTLRGVPHFLKVSIYQMKANFILSSIVTTPIIMGIWFILSGRVWYLSTQLKYHWVLT